MITVFADVLEKESVDNGASIIQDPIIISTLCCSAGFVYMYVLMALANYRKTMKAARHQRRAAAATAGFAICHV